MLSLALILCLLPWSQTLPLSSSFSEPFNAVADFYAANPSTSSQYHAQDEFGAYNYGYDHLTSSKQEIRRPDGSVQGSYAYLDPIGRERRVEYSSDAINGFRAVEKANGGPNINVVSHGAPVHPVLANQQHVVAQQHVAPQPHAAPRQHVVAQPHVAPVVPQPHVAAPVPARQLTYAPAYGHDSYVTQSQFHAQDEFGQYHFGYAEPNSARTELKTADGSVQGSYHYVDDKGLLQTVQYTADKYGFRAAGTNIPVASLEGARDTPEVAAAKIDHYRRVEEIRERDRQWVLSLQEKAVSAVPAAVPAVSAENVVIPNEQVVTLEGPVAKRFFPAAIPAAVQPAVQPAYEAEPAVQPAFETRPNVQPAVQTQVIPEPVVYAEPQAVNLRSNVDLGPAPAPQPAIPQYASEFGYDSPPVVVSSQYHAQDEFGQYNYGYSNILSSKQEVKTADGVVRGSYSYVDANGLVQSVSYVSDPVNGFRATGTNFPEDENSRRLDHAAKRSHLEPYANRFPHHFYIV